SASRSSTSPARSTARGRRDAAELNGRRRRATLGGMSTPTPTRTWAYLAPNPRSFYKQLFIKGTRIRAESVYAWTVAGSEPMTPEQVAEDMGLPLEAVREAVAYCESNPPELRDDHRREELLSQATGMSDPNYDGRPKLLSAQELTRIRRS